MWPQFFAVHEWFIVAIGHKTYMFLTPKEFHTCFGEYVTTNKTTYEGCPCSSSNEQIYEPFV